MHNVISCCKYKMCIVYLSYYDMHNTRLSILHKRTEHRESLHGGAILVHYTEHPYIALNAHIDELQACYDAIEHAKQQLRETQKKQLPLIQAALYKAHEDGDLKSLAQFLYLDAPEGIWRDKVKDVVNRFIPRHVQSWLCEGYTYQIICVDCDKPFPYPIKSFTDLQEISKPEPQAKQRKFSWKWRRRCSSCDQAFTNKNTESWRRREAREAEIVKQLRALPYREYLLTEHWKSVRTEALRKAKFRCQLCNASGELHVHHRSYEHLGEEQDYMHDVIVLCRACHEKHHDIRSR